MASVAWDYARTGIWRFSRRDAILVALAVLHGVVLAAWPLAPLIAVGVWWNSNTIAHNFIHRPFFRSAGMNRVFSAALSVLLGIPQTLWRDRHLAHHAGVASRLRVSRQLGVETALILSLWATLTLLQPRFFLLAYLPGYLTGLGLCAMQGYWEHATGRPISHYGRIYNFFCFNDGYHAEHHADPNPRNLETARVFLGGNIEYRNERYLHGGSFDCDLTVIPLCLDGDRAAIYHHPPSPAVLVHDWIWRVRGSGTIVSAVLLKRLNLVRQ